LALVGLGVLVTDLVLVDQGRHSWSPWRLLAPLIGVALLILLPRDKRPTLGLQLPPPGHRAKCFLSGLGVIGLLVGWWATSHLSSAQNCFSSSETSLYFGRGAFATRQWWLLGLVGVVGEELIYRIGSLPHLITGIGTGPAIAVDATAFTILHLLYYHQFLWLYPVGALAYAGLFAVSRSAWLVLLAHYGTNLTAAAASLALWQARCA
jgi:membrane protease YdiL (CAAX protease family)